MPIRFWEDKNNEKYIGAYFNDYNKKWKHGDFILINDNYGVKIFGRSDSTLNPGGIRIGTAEIYQALNNLKYIKDSLVVGQIKDKDERIVLFVMLNNDIDFNCDIKKEIKMKIRNYCSPKHVPSIVLPIEDIPYTMNGKKVEVAVKKIINGFEVDNKESLVNPESLEFYKDIKELHI
jgi:acetoacetyl-CoA synthetase